MNLTDAIVEYQTDLTPEFCAEVIERFNADDRTVRGSTGGGLNENIKQSEDLFITDLDGWGDIDTKFFEAITDYIQEYHIHMNGISPSYSLADVVSDLGYQLQKTKPNEFYDWHHDGCQSYFSDMEFTTSSGATNRYITQRIYTYIVYLNDRIGLEEGRTQFLFGDDVTSIEPKLGKLLMFPANELYTHRGETLLTGEKYIMTGWCVVPSMAGFRSPSEDDLANFQTMIEVPGNERIRSTDTL